jgi:hypothetical protein
MEITDIAATTRGAGSKPLQNNFSMDSKCLKRITTTYRWVSED